MTEIKEERNGEERDCREPVCPLSVPIDSIHSLCTPPSCIVCMSVHEMQDKKDSFLVDVSFAG